MLPVEEMPMGDVKTKKVSILTSLVFRGVSIIWFRSTGLLLLMMIEVVAKVMF